MKLVRGILHHLVDMVIDFVNLSADSYYRGINSPFGYIGLLNGTLQRELGIDDGSSSPVNGSTQLLEFRHSVNNTLFEILALHILLDFIHHVIEVRLVIIVSACSNRHIIGF